MNRQYVQSTDLRSVGYNAVSAVLEIEFNSGGVYQYSNVPVSVYQALINAPSHGKYFHANIKDRYHTTRIG